MSEHEMEAQKQRMEARELAKRILPLFQGKTIEFYEETIDFMRYKLQEALRNTPINLSSEDN